MNAAEILEDQVLHMKRGRTNKFGWEPAWNSYFDFYLSPRYIDPPLLQLEDVTFHLFLRKNLNDQNPAWKMPSVRQMKRRLSIGQTRLKAMLTRLDAAHLLKKVSGYQQGEALANIPNHYILSDPIQTLEEFLVVASAGVFPHALKEEWRAVLAEAPLYPIQVQGEPKLSTPPVPELGTHKQTFSLKQTEGSENDRLWETVLSVMKMQLTTNTFYSFVADTHLLKIDGPLATIGTPRTFAKDWLENRLSNNLKKAINLELRLRDGDTAQQIERVQFVFSAEGDAAA